MLPPRNRARRIDAEHGNVLAAVANEMHAQRVDEGALADAGHAGDAHAPRLARCAAEWRRATCAARSPSAGRSLSISGDGAREDDAIAAAQIRRRHTAAGARRLPRALTECWAPLGWLHQRVENRLRAERNHRARAEDARYARGVQKIVILRRNHAADEDQNVFAAQLLQLAITSGTSVLCPPARLDTPST